MSTCVGERIRELRLKQGLTLLDLAERARSSRSYLWQIENKDVAHPSASKLHAIASALGTTSEYLLFADKVTATDAADTAFFQRYLRLEPKSKKRLRAMLKILDDGG